MYIGFCWEKFAELEERMGRVEPFIRYAWTNELQVSLYFVSYLGSYLPRLQIEPSKYFKSYVCEKIIDFLIIRNIRSLDTTLYTNGNIMK